MGIKITLQSYDAITFYIKVLCRTTLSKLFGMLSLFVVLNFVSKEGGSITNSHDAGVSWESRNIGLF